MSGAFLALPLVLAVATSGVGTGVALALTLALGGDDGTGLVSKELSSSPSRVSWAMSV